MKATIIPLICAGLLAGCAELQLKLPDFSQKETTATPGQAGEISGPAPVPVANARTPEQFDTTSAEQRREAVNSGAVGGRLGTTIASLGSPTEPGFWLKTPLVSDPRPGHIQLIKGGEHVEVELRPLAGAAGAGSQISLPAMRLLNIPLTDLPELVVFGG